MSTSVPHNRVDGLYFNTSPEPAYVNDVLIGGHEWVFIEGYIRVPGQFVRSDDPTDNEDAPESYVREYKKMMDFAEESRKEVHANSANNTSNVVPIEQPEAVESVTTSRTSRKPKGDKANQ